MKYCWDVYKKSACENCKFYVQFIEGALDIQKHKHILTVEDD